ncbi:hypothetical protein [Idiomarina abyssalis]|uniref:Uncharacterized protein n=1 Tax=Idiomarina abyssalis TaxID=86102 RepID=A0A8I1KIF9_9GAMM|nr:hypothetical protein [Idiomarina abyssalis]MBJ7265451.1 hypothetical protein [Idiomarina abyssalis]MBJ7316875.1 hypothetical protein [Idiomarina abyssalis]
MVIKPAEITRDDIGAWVHPDLPEWDEGTTQDEINDWFETHSISYEFIRFESQSSQEQFDRYYEDGNSDLTDWKPTCDKPGSFLLSIHETEDGPVALFAVPQ